MNENIKLQYFNSDVKISGKHATYLDELWKQNNIQESYIRTLYELYPLAAVIGLKLKKKVEEDKGDVRNIQLTQLNNVRHDLLHIMKMVLLLDDSTELTKEERIERAFSGPKTVEEVQENMDLFNSYVRGGIEYLHEELVERPVLGEDEYTDARLANIVALINNSDFND
ncbi:hypothetical protein [Bovifimicola ammoniilytica]|uniref:hypothetical protein n=1 Tax=Bovifimicola ammoniilytica TaxID=2981720 RepID=UPI000820A210|nr:hypothetical protein [Bovifimicola ammoniilytica]MCU6754624.1 hypothetical protein [Bovifimicola ammoniilytica]SCJ87765.1 Uncharacterised protein [uncultured Eubacterium sp.]